MWPHTRLRLFICETSCFFGSWFNCIASDILTSPWSTGKIALKRFVSIYIFVSYFIYQNDRKMAMFGYKNCYGCSLYHLSCCHRSATSKCWWCFNNIKSILSTFLQLFVGYILCCSLYLVCEGLKLSISLWSDLKIMSYWFHCEHANQYSVIYNVWRVSAHVICLGSLVSAKHK